MNTEFEKCDNRMNRGAKHKIHGRFVVHKWKFHYCIHPLETDRGKDFHEQVFGRIDPVSKHHSCKLSLGKEDSFYCVFVDGTNEEYKTFIDNFEKEAMSRAMFPLSTNEVYLN